MSSHDVRTHDLIGRRAHAKNKNSIDHTKKEQVRCLNTEFPPTSALLVRPAPDVHMYMYYKSVLR